MSETPARLKGAIEAERDSLTLLSGRDDRVGAYARCLLKVVE